MKSTPTKYKRTLEERRAQNLKILSFFMKPGDKAKRKLISKEDAEVYQVQFNEDFLTLSGLKTFHRTVKFALLRTSKGPKTFKDIKELNEYLNTSRSVDLFREDCKSRGLYFESIDKIKLNWNQIDLKKIEDYLSFIVYLPVNGTPKNMNSNHINAEILAVRGYMVILSLQDESDLREEEVSNFKEKFEILQRLSYKLYKKCYYYGKQSGTSI